MRALTVQHLLPLLSLFAAPELALPPAADLDRFRHAWWGWERALACRAHLARLDYLAAVSGWDGGRWEEARQRVEFEERFWLTLNLAASSEGVARRRALRDLLELVGLDRYRAGWEPGGIEAPDPWPAGPPPRGGANGR